MSQSKSRFFWLFYSVLSIAYPIDTVMLGAHAQAGERSSERVRPMRRTNRDRAVLRRFGESYLGLLDATDVKSAMRELPEPALRAHIEGYVRQLRRLVKVGARSPEELWASIGTLEREYAQAHGKPLRLEGYPRSVESVQKALASDLGRSAGVTPATRALIHQSYVDPADTEHSYRRLKRLARLAEVVRATPSIEINPATIGELVEQLRVSGDPVARSAEDMLAHHSSMGGLVSRKEAKQLRRAFRELTASIVAHEHLLGYREKEPAPAEPKPDATDQPEPEEVEDPDLEGRKAPRPAHSSEAEREGSRADTPTPTPKPHEESNPDQKDANPTETPATSDSDHSQPQAVEEPSMASIVPARTSSTTDDAWLGRIFGSQAGRISASVLRIHRDTYAAEFRYLNLIQEGLCKIATHLLHADHLSAEKQSVLATRLLLTHSTTAEQTILHLYAALQRKAPEMLQRKYQYLDSLEEKMGIGGKGIRRTVSKITSRLGRKKQRKARHKLRDTRVELSQELNKGSAKQKEHAIQVSEALGNFISDQYELGFIDWRLMGMSLRNIDGRPPTLKELHRFSFHVSDKAANLLTRQPDADAKPPAEEKHQEQAEHFLTRPAPLSEGETKNVTLIDGVELIPKQPSED